MTTPRNALKVISFIEAHTQANFTSNQANALLNLQLAGNDGLSVGELGNALGVSHVTASKLVRVMGDYGLKGRNADGWGLVDFFYSPDRPRATMVRLSKKGDRMLKDALSMF